MNEKQLRTFKTFIDEKSENNAALVLGVSQPTINFHLRKLQEYAEIKLYHKKGTRIILTPAGEMLYQYSQNVLSTLNEADLSLKEYQNYKYGTLKIGVSQTPLNSLLPEVFRSYIDEYPDIKVSVYNDNAPAIIKKIEERELDIGVISESGVSNEELNVKRLLENPLMLVVNKKHPINNIPTLHLKDLLEYRFIIHSNGTTRKGIDEWVAKNLITLKISLEINSISSILIMVQQSDFIGLLTKHSINDNDNIVVRELPEGPMSKYISLVFRKDKFLSPIINNFIVSLERAANDRKL